MSVAEKRKIAVAAVKEEDKFLALENVLMQTGFFNQLEHRFSLTHKSREEFLVAVKANFMFMYSKNDRSTYTDPELVEYLVKKIVERGFTNIAVVEAQSTYGNYFKNRGVRSVAGYIGYREDGYRVVDLSEESEPYDFGGRLGTHPVGKVWKQADYRISFAKNKTHTFCYYTLTIKNIYGALAMQNKLKEYHNKREIYWPTIEMLKHFPVHYGLIDAHLSADGQFGIFADRYPNPTKTIIGGADLVAVDWVGARKMGLDPMVSRYMKLAVAAFGFPEIEWLGDKSEYSPWRNVNTVFVESLDKIEEVYNFTNTFFMAFNDMDPYFVPRKRTSLIKLLRKIFIPVRNAIMRERINPGALKVLKPDLEKRTKVLKRRYSLEAEGASAYVCFLENFEVIVPEYLMIVRKITPGRAGTGTRYSVIPNFLFKSMVNMEITNVVDGREVVLEFLEKSPFLGKLSVVFVDSGGASTVEVSLYYQLQSLGKKMGWKVFGGERFYNGVVEEGMKSLNDLLKAV